MVKEVNAETLAVVLETWAELKKLDDYEKLAGSEVMAFLFKKCPKAKPMFGYDIEADVEGEFLEDPKFIAHSVQLIHMFDSALNMLGPDGKLLTEKIRELGEKHVTYGVRAEMFPIMGKALYGMLENQLGDKFNDDVHEAWKVVFGAISNDLMLTVLKASKAENAKILQPQENVKMSTAA